MKRTSLSPALASEPLSAPGSQPPLSQPTKVAGETPSAAAGPAPSRPAADKPAPEDLTVTPASGAGRFAHELATALAPSIDRAGAIAWRGDHLRARHASSPPHIADTLARLRSDGHPMMRAGHDLIVALVQRMYGQAALAAQANERSAAAEKALRNRGAVNASAAIDLQQLRTALADFAMSERHRADLARRGANPQLAAAHDGAAAFVEALINPAGEPS